MADELNELRLFTRIVAAGSLSETARRLNSSLPAMSRRLSALEARLGVRLIERGSRHFALTEEGALLHERSIGILADLDATEAEVSLTVKAPRGRLRVGAPLEIGRRRIAPLVAEFTERYPGISVELALSDARQDVVGDELDVGIHVDLPSDGSIVSRKLLSSHRVVCASPDYVARHGQPATPSDLLSHNCILFVRGRHVFDRWSFAEGDARREVQVGGTLSTNNAEVMHEWALAGRGVALKALWDIEADLKAGRLVELLGSFSYPDLNLYLTYPTRNYLPPRVRVFIDFIAAAIGRQDPDPPREDSASGT